MPVSSDYKKRVVQAYAGSKQQLLASALRELKEKKKKEVANLTIPRQLDLAEFYDIVPGTPSHGIAEQIKAVVNELNKLKVTSPSPSLKAAATFMLELHNLNKDCKEWPDLLTKKFWDNLQGERKQAEVQRLAEFSRLVVQESGALGAVTESRLRQLARESGFSDALSDAELKRAITAAGGRVVEALPVLTVSPQLIRDVREGLKKTSCRSVLSAVFFADFDLNGEIDTFKILEGFQSLDRMGLRLTLEAVVKSHARSKTSIDNDNNSAIGSVLTAIVGAVTTDSGLHDLVVAHFIEIGSQIAKDVQFQVQALSAFTERTGIDRDDAVRILVNVMDGKTQSPGGYPEVLSRVAEGTLKAARRLYDATITATNKSESTPQKNALDALTAAEERVEKLRSTARDAVDKSDIESARNALSEALTICTDDPTLEEIFRRLPPAAPLRVVATAVDEGQHVRLSWEPGFGDTEDVRYQVVRKVGSAPSNNADGTPVKTGLTDTFFMDAQSPVAATLYYGVSATRGEGFSPVTVVSIRLLPPVREVQTSSDLASVSLRWASPAGARAIEVIQVAPNGTKRQIPVGAQGGAISSGLTMGDTYTYLITAIYTGQDGAELRSEAVRKTAVPRGKAAAVALLSLVDRTNSNGSPEIEASWQSIAGYVVEVWHFAQRPSWVFGSRAPMAEVRSHGTQLAGQETGSGARQGVRGPAGNGLRYYVAITRDGDEALFGQIQPFGICPTVSDPVPERFNEEVRLRWTWPGAEYDVLVCWTCASGSGKRTIARSDYLKEGCHIHVGTGGAVFTLSTVAGEANGQWSSTETRVEVPPLAAVVRWDIQFHRKLFFAPRSATLRFSGTGVGSVDVVVIGARSRTMPHDATQGTVLATASVNPEANAELYVNLPRGDGPFWVRAFLKNAGPRLADPPPSQMKVE